MAEKGVSDQQLADAIGVDRVTVTRYANRTKRPPPEKLRAIADFLDVEPEDLWHRPKGGGRARLDRTLKDAPDEALGEVAELAAVVMKRYR